MTCGGMVMHNSTSAAAASCRNDSCSINAVPPELPVIESCLKPAMYKTRSQPVGYTILQPRSLIVTYIYIFIDRHFTCTWNEICTKIYDFITSFTNTRRSHCYKLFVPACKSSIRYDCFSYRVVRVWNTAVCRNKSFNFSIYLDRGYM